MRATSGSCEKCRIPPLAKMSELSQSWADRWSVSHLRKIEHQSYPSLKSDTVQEPLYARYCRHSGSLWISAGWMPQTRETWCVLVCSCIPFIDIFLWWVNPYQTENGTNQQLHFPPIPLRNYAYRWRNTPVRQSACPCRICIPSLLR